MELNSSNLDNSQEFQKTIEESKQAIFSEQQKEVKKGRGRPQGAKARPKMDETQQSNQNLSPTSSQTPDISKYLVGPLIAISKPIANKHKIDSLALSEEEAKACAESLNEVLKAFAPSLNQMSPKTAAVLGAFVTFGSIGFSKYQIYLSESEKRLEKLESQDMSEESKPVNKNVGIPADSYFTKRL